MSKRAYGFTIVELLVVIVVIAILAAISIVAYRGIQDRANNSAASAKVTQAAKKVQLYYAEHTEYPDTLISADVPDSQGIDYTRRNDTNPKTFCITATVSNKSYYMNSTTNTSPTPGGCPGHSQGGVAAITNMARNPAGTNTATAEWGGRWSWTTSFITGASDGPSGGPSTYARTRSPSSATSGGTRGFSHLTNVDQVSPANTNQSWPVRANTPVTLSLWVRSSISHPDIQLVFRVHNGAGAWVSSRVSGPSQSYSANTWVRISHTYTPPVDGYLAAGTYFFESASWPGNSTIDATGMMLTEGTSNPGYADGNSPNWVWNGPENDSTSTGPAL